MDHNTENNYSVKGYHYDANRSMDRTYSTEKAARKQLEKAKKSGYWASLYIKEGDQWKQIN